MMKNKTDIEIAADAIKYCKNELNKYNGLLEKYENTNMDVSERTIAMWKFERQRLEYVLGLSDKRPIFPYAKEEVRF